MSRPEVQAESALAAAGEAGAGVEVVTHPVYGTLLHDFGYKKVYAMSAEQLVSKDKVAVYEQQRAFRAGEALTDRSYCTGTLCVVFPDCVLILNRYNMCCVPYHWSGPR